MNLNEIIQSDRKPVQEIVSRKREKKYFVDDSFQRKLVWTEKQKVRLIETILMNYPMPEIYIWAQEPDPESGEQNHSIVDGQQRITALEQFVSNEWPLKTSHLNPEHADESYACKFWKDLSDEQKKTIWGYYLNVRIIPNSVTKEQIQSVFRRLNETDRSLNPQELRNAEFNGEFITAAEEITNLSFWRKWNVFLDSQVRRMRDIEFASELLIFLRKGIVTDDARSINSMYDSYNDIYKEREEDIETVKLFLDFLDKTLEERKVLQKMFTRANDIYSLFCLFVSKKIEGKSLEEYIDKLCEFAMAYTNEKDHPLIGQYTEGVSSRTRSKSNREKRFYALEDWIAS